MANREFLMLAKTLDKSLTWTEWMMSEKYDGTRAFWDGGITRGKDTTTVPWANLNKTYKPISTGLWSRYGNVISAPDWFLDRLPRIPLDGELYLARGEFQESRSIVAQHSPDDRWRDIKFVVFDSPPYSSLFQTGKINNVNFKKDIDFNTCLDFVGPSRVYNCNVYTFDRQLAHLDTIIEECKFGNLILAPQERVQSREHMEEKLFEVSTNGGEGLMLRKAQSLWTPKRSAFLLKVKKMADAEGKVVGWEPGKGKYEGLMGSLLIEFMGKRFNLSGFTDEERTLAADGYPVYFPLGSMITFKYRELTVDGLPKEARYWRK